MIEPGFHVIVSATLVALMAHVAAAQSPRHYSGIGPVDPYQPPSAQPLVYHVDASATGANDGTSWCDAFNDLQDALLAAGDAATIHVADGVYEPDQGGGQTPGDRDARFEMTNGLKLLGGFAGCGAYDPDAREPSLYVSILCGDLLGDDDTGGGIGDNSYSVVRASLAGETTLLSGFTLTAGNGFGGGGILLIDSTMSVEDCIFEGNRGGNGGAVRSTGNGERTFKRCTFVDNYATEGGGAMNLSIGPVHLFDCHFEGNSTSFEGGAIYHYSNMTIVRCTFVGNSSGKGGAIRGSNSISTHNCRFIGNTAGTGGAVFYSQSPGLFVNCLFDSNVATTNSGAISHLGTGVSYVSCTIVNNSAGSWAGGLDFFNIGPTDALENCIIWGNTAPSFANVYASNAATARYCNVQGGWPSLGVGNINADPLFDGSADFLLSCNSPCIDAGNTSLLPLDDFDLDLDGDLLEAIPMDIRDASRQHDDPGMGDSGIGPYPVVDIGAAEYALDSAGCAATGPAGNGTVGAPELLQLLSVWGSSDGPEDVDGDGAVDIADLMMLLAAWGQRH